MSKPDSTDVVVIGGGIIGCSTAYYLASKGIHVTLCEKGRIGGEQSSRNWGFIRKQGRHPAEIPLMIQSARLWQELVSEMDQDIGFHIGGTLYLSETEKRYQANQAWLDKVSEFNLDSRFLSVSELGSLIPEIQNQKRGALFTPSDARAEPDLATTAIANLARGKGALIKQNCAVRGLDTEAGSVCGVITENGRIKASSVVCAGGVWSSYFCRHLDILFPQLKVISSVMATQPASLNMQQSLWSTGLGMRKRLDGGFNVAYGGGSICEITPDFFKFFSRFLPTYRQSKEAVSLRLNSRFLKEWKWPHHWNMDEETPFEKERTLDPSPNERLLNKAYTKLGKAFPEMRDIGIAKKWAGMIDVTPDELPVIDAMDAVPGLVLSSGYSGHGFGIGPGAGKVTAELVTGKTPSTDISPFSLNRLTTKQ